jgi:pantetheine-phosphate adenylyltransferase
MKKITAIYAGSFDPVTFGHIDIIGRASELFEKLVVAIGANSLKKNIFSEQERFAMMKKACLKFKNVEVDTFSELIVKYAKKKNASVLIRGLRAVSDFDFEFQMYLMNKKMHPGLSTIFLMPDEKYVYLNSSLIREVARMKGDVSSFVPKFVEKKLKEKFK